MVTLACIALTLAAAGYVFWPERAAASQVQKPRADYLRERQAVLEENLRDLRFEREAGKYGEQEYGAEQAVLEGEAAAVRHELEALAGRKERG